MKLLTLFILLAVVACNKTPDVGPKLIDYHVMGKKIKIDGQLNPGATVTVEQVQRDMSIGVKLLPGEGN